MIIGITGTIGAGKGAVVEYLCTKHKFLHLSARDFITQEIVRRGLVVSRDSMMEVANDLRASHSPSFIIQSLYKQAAGSNQHAVIESIRNIGEVEFLKAQPGFYLLAVDADPRQRYERIVERKSVTDHITFEKFVAEEEREMQSEDKHKQNLSACIQMADFTITNKGTFEELHAQVDQLCTDYLHIKEVND